MIGRDSFDLPGPIVLERGDVARIVGERNTAPTFARGLVPCPTCSTLQAPRDGHMAVHFPTREATRPCAGSWPSKAAR